METAAIAPPAFASFVPPRADFADWLSPMLVKELRQGVRTRVFVILFILLQVALLLDLVLSLLVAAAGESATAGSYVFWLMVAVPTLLILPLSALNAIGSEIRGNTLELIFLTRLTAFRIVVGKWFALFAQSLLLVCAALPYLVLRYFMGGINLTVELLQLGAVLVGSALLIAVATGISAFPARIVRPLAVVAGLLVFLVAVNVVVGRSFRGSGASSLPDFAQIGTVLICSALGIGLMLDVGAARIAPPAENHSAAMRALACAGLLVAWLTEAFSPRFAGVTDGAFVVAVVVCTVAVCEQPRAIPSLYRPFARRGLPGRLLGKFLYPGWHTGVMFLLVMFAAFGALLTHEKTLDHGDLPARYIALIGTLLMPVALVRTVLRRVDRPTALFFVIQIVSVIVFVFCLVCDGALNTHLKSFMVALPLCALMDPSSSGFPSFWAGNSLPTFVVTAVSIVALLIASVPVFRQTRRLERESLDLPAPPKNDAPRATRPAAPHAPLA